MRFISERTSDGVSERLFSLGDVPGVLWTPAGATGGPLILQGHGGGRHKLAESLVARARGFVAGGFAVAAIDAPGHGDRPMSAAGARLLAGLRERVAAGERIGPLMAQLNEIQAVQGVPEWRATLDALQELGFDGPVGFSGLSMGSGIGIPFVAAEPRIQAAIFGLAGQGLEEAAARITIPVQFLLQWDDELIPRDDCLALFGAFASAEKTLHANPGPHAGIPAFELESSLRFFARHLLG